jgi:hypothetical protein
MTPRRTALAAAALATPALLATMLVAPTTAAAADPLAMEPVGRYVAPRAPEIPAADDQVRAESHAVLGDRLYATNHTSLDIVDISDPENPTLVTQVDLSSYGATGITSVAASKGRVAVAIPATDKTQPGTVALLNPSGKVLRTVTVGALPDMLTFDEDGKRILVANEGEPASYPSTAESDPKGTISVIDVAKMMGGKADAVRTISFDSITAGSLNEYVRIFGPGATIAQDLEPEYITVQGDTAFVSLQENNAIAEIDLRAGRVVAVRGLEFKDHSLADNGYGSSNALDASDRDGSISIANWPVTGMPMPDAITSFAVGGQTYLVSANEGDSRADWPGFTEEERIKDLVGKDENTPYVDDFGREITLDDSLYATLKGLRGDSALGRLRMSTAPGTAGGDTDGDGDIDRILTYGTRSMSIWTADGTRVWDSGDILEQQTALALPAHFNNNNDENAFDSRSDDKGPEPEGVAVGEIDGRTYAFLGLERIGGMAVFDVTNPASTTFVEYVTTRDFEKDPTDGSTDSGPEVVTFVPADESPNGEPLVLVSNEWSGSIVIWSPKG